MILHWILYFINCYISKSLNLLALIGWSPNIIIKETAESICLSLYCCLLNLSSGDLPYSWKKGHVIPLFMKSSSNSVLNYHPITLTSIISRVLESFILLKILYQVILLTMPCFATTNIASCLKILHYTAIDSYELLH